MYTSNGEHAAPHPRSGPSFIRLVFSIVGLQMLNYAYPLGSIARCRCKDEADQRNSGRRPRGCPRTLYYVAGSQAVAYRRRSGSTPAVFTT
jgi:hypothetical protein